jgi:hypothetical protein
MTRFETAENVANVDWLPQSASNVSYYRSYRFTAYEFDMAETDFKRWTPYEVKPIDSPVKVARYWLISRGYSDLGPNPKRAEWEAWEASAYATISDGLYYSHRRSDGGGVDVAFDRRKGRVFFQTNPR